ncbi:nuclear transport factor 2 family protein [Aliidiomarina shirensis]|uniref:Nuclear transport factor 2 family protein n=1 Tax=Aliidiomarina shirensis TaxID=1048642 RepID=A0A432WXI2_9GAMM|nr:nuclear transport factor 2 family protein [Aliidiomarina shirensis]RUO38437.1 nuclear transport factor 2 family protein [Aliidiomarina shirensis]
MTDLTQDDREELVADLQAMYSDFNKDSVAKADSIYHAEISFRDPILQVNGIDDLQRYFNHGIANATSCHFAFDTQVVNRERAFLTWQMRLQHEKLAGGREIVVPGCTHLEFADDENSVRHHVDYYDVGAMVYEHVPVIGYLVNKVRQRLESFD